MLAKTLSQRPCELLGYWIDPWAAYQLDSAVVLLGVAIENALNELANVGTEDSPKHEPRYKLEQLLDPCFRLPSQSTEEAPDFDALKGIHGISVEGL